MLDFFISPHHPATRLAGLCLLCSFGLVACSSATETAAIPAAASTEDRPTADFHSIENHSFVDLVLSTSEQPSLRITCVAELLPKVSATVNKEVLVIKNEAGTTLPQGGVCKIEAAASKFRSLKLKGSGSLRAEAELPGLNNVEVTGSGDVSLAALSADLVVVDVQGSGELVAASVVAKELYLRSAGSGQLDMSGLALTKVDIMAAGSTDINLVGEAEGIIVVSQGSGDLDASKLVSKHAAVTSRRSGNSIVFASESINAALMGSGNISVLGKPGKRQANAEGSGKLSYD